MIEARQYLCSELVTVTYERQPGEIRQTVANLEEISTDTATVLLEEEPRLGASISLAIQGRDLFGVIASRVCDATLGWFITVTLDAASHWSRDWFTPTHLLDTCRNSLEGLTHDQARALASTSSAEENTPVNFVFSQA
jgi:hypothetical protein